MICKDAIFLFYCNSVYIPIRNFIVFILVHYSTSDSFLSKFYRKVDLRYLLDKMLYTNVYRLHYEYDIFILLITNLYFKEVFVEIYITRSKLQGTK